MEEFISSLPEEGKKAASDVEEFFNNFKAEVQTWNNIQMVPSFSMSAAKHAYNHWTPREKDVFVVTYPKTGSHWMAELVKQIYFIRDPKWMNLMKLMSAGWKGPLAGQSCLETGPPSKFTVSDYFPWPRVFFTHLPVEIFNYKKVQENNAKVIYVYRNPKDLAVSYFNFAKKIPYPPELEYQRNETWDECLETFTAGKHHTGVPVGEWYPYHIKSWWKHKGDKNMLIVSFEDMKQDLASEVRKIMKFLDVERTDEEVDEIVKRCSFDTMRKDNDSQMGRALYRKGQVGEWKNHFTVAQSEMFDKKLAEELKGIDISFKYEI